MSDTPSSAGSDVDDSEFTPGCVEQDDESTIAIEEIQDSNSADEIADLQAESEIPLEELLARYGCYSGIDTYSANPSNSSASQHSTNGGGSSNMSSSAEEDILSNGDLTLDKDEVGRDLLGEKHHGSSVNGSSPILIPADHERQEHNSLSSLSKAKSQRDSTSLDALMDVIDRPVNMPLLSRLPGKNVPDNYHNTVNSNSSSSTSPDDLDETDERHRPSTSSHYYSTSSSSSTRDWVETIGTPSSSLVASSTSHRHQQQNPSEFGHQRESVMLNFSPHHNLHSLFSSGIHQRGGVNKPINNNLHHHESTNFVNYYRSIISATAHNENPNKNETSNDGIDNHNLYANDDDEEDDVDYFPESGEILHEIDNEKSTIHVGHEYQAVLPPCLCSLGDDNDILTTATDLSTTTESATTDDSLVDSGYQRDTSSSFDSLNSTSQEGSERFDANKKNLVLLQEKFEAPFISEDLLQWRPSENEIALEDFLRKINNILHDPTLLFEQQAILKKAESKYSTTANAQISRSLHSEQHRNQSNDNDQIISSLSTPTISGVKDDDSTQRSVTPELRVTANDDTIAKGATIALSHTIPNSITKGVIDNGAISTTMEVQPSVTSTTEDPIEQILTDGEFHHFIMKKVQKEEDDETDGKDKNNEKKYETQLKDIAPQENSSSSTKNHVESLVDHEDALKILLRCDYDTEEASKRFKVYLLKKKGSESLSTISTQQSFSSSLSPSSKHSTDILIDSSSSFTSFTPVNPTPAAWTCEDVQSFEKGLAVVEKDFLSISNYYFSFWSPPLLENDDELKSTTKEGVKSERDNVKTGSDEKKSRFIVKKSRADLVFFYYFWKKTDRYEMFKLKYKLKRRRQKYSPYIDDLLELYLNKLIQQNSNTAKTPLVTITTTTATESNPSTAFITANNTILNDATSRDDITAITTTNDDVPSFRLPLRILRRLSQISYAIKVFSNDDPSFVNKKRLKRIFSSINMTMKNLSSSSTSLSPSSSKEDAIIEVPLNMETSVNDSTYCSSGDDNVNSENFEDDDNDGGASDEIKDNSTIQQTVASRISKCDDLKSTPSTKKLLKNLRWLYYELKNFERQHYVQIQEKIRALKFRASTLKQQQRSNEINSSPYGSREVISADTGITSSHNNSDIYYDSCFLSSTISSEDDHILDNDYNDKSITMQHSSMDNLEILSTDGNGITTISHLSNVLTTSPRCSSPSTITTSSNHNFSLAGSGQTTESESFSNNGSSADSSDSFYSNTDHRERINNDNTNRDFDDSAMITSLPSTTATSSEMISDIITTTTTPSLFANENEASPIDNKTTPLIADATAATAVTSASFSVISDDVSDVNVGTQKEAILCQEFSSNNNSNDASIEEMFVPSRGKRAAAVVSTTGSGEQHDMFLSKKGRFEL